MNNRKQFAAKVRQLGFFVKFPINKVENSEYIRLYRSTLDVTLCDLIKGKEFFLQNKDHTESDWNDTVSWVDSTNFDFQTVCGFSEFDPVSAEKIINYIVDNVETLEKEQKWENLIQIILKASLNPKD